MTVDTIIFDFGNVLLEWDPHRIYDSYFGSREKASWFIENICTPEWNGEVDAGKSIAQATQELVARHPVWEKEIRMYFDRWIEMIGSPVEGMYELVNSVKAKGYRTLGLTNWSLETFRLVRYEYPVFSLMDGMVISGEEHCLKPDERIFRILLQRYSLEPSQCLFIDDNPDNVRGAEALGIKALQFSDADSLRADLKLAGII